MGSPMSYDQNLLADQTRRSGEISLSFQAPRKKTRHRKTFFVLANKKNVEKKSLLEKAQVRNDRDRVETTTAFCYSTCSTLWSPSTARAAETGQTHVPPCPMMRRCMSLRFRSLPPAPPACCSLLPDSVDDAHQASTLIEGSGAMCA